MRRSMLGRLAVAACSLSLLTAFAPAAVAQADGGGHDRSYKKVGYFTQWGVYGRDFQVQDLEANGSAGKLTHINYAFGNV
ncbi:glycosyl hydrolase, partial [Streptomyces sp. SID1046]|nr:glycosyl hydrolase [Streptomyces sp. SID1046]